MRRQPSAAITNRDLSELFVREAAQVPVNRARELLRAARKAYLWPVEAAEWDRQEESLLALPGMKAKTAALIRKWLQNPPAVPAPDESRQEFLTMAEANAVLAKHPAWLRQVKGDLQMHTTWSDGEASVVEMAAEGVSRGYEYLAITDHTAGLKVAHGMDEKTLRKQGDEIRQVNEALRVNGVSKFTVLHSAEVNLSPSGEVDISARALQHLDLVLGSFHSALDASGDQTRRYLAALKNPAIHILGHPQTRRFNQRRGLLADWPRVFATAAIQGKAVEIDGYAERQDLRLSLLAIARREGCLISLGSDAHDPSQLDFLRLALATACLAKIPKARIINFWSLEKLLRWTRGEGAL